MVAYIILCICGLAFKITIIKFRTLLSRKGNAKWAFSLPQHSSVTDSPGLPERHRPKHITAVAGLFVVVLLATEDTTRDYLLRYSRVTWSVT